MNDGQKIYSWIKELYPIRRTLAGPGTDKTLEFLKYKIPNLKINKYMSGTKVFDWTVPNEWHLDFGYIKDPDGNLIIHSDNSSLHIVGYSESVNKKITLNELKKHLYTLEDLPTAIPYVTSFYDKNWGFCIPYNDYKNLKDGEYEVFIKSSFVKGDLKTAEYVKKGKSKKYQRRLKEESKISVVLSTPRQLVLKIFMASNLEVPFVDLTRQFIDLESDFISAFSSNVEPVSAISSTIPISFSPTTSKVLTADFISANLFGFWVEKMSFFIIQKYSITCSS